MVVGRQPRLGRRRRLPGGVQCLGLAGPEGRRRLPQSSAGEPRRLPEGIEDHPVDPGREQNMGDHEPAGGTQGRLQEPVGKQAAGTDRADQGSVQGGVAADQGVIRDIAAQDGGRHRQHDDLPGAGSDPAHG